MKNILLGVTGSVAATLVPKIVAALQHHGHRVQIVATESSFYFWQENAVDVPVYKEYDEWPDGQYQKDMPILHIALREWADALVIAPLTANTLAKLANGLCDNLLTSVVRAWNTSKPLVLAPAMNTMMWNKCITDKHLAVMHIMYQARVVQPIAKKLACGDEGIGAMADITSILEQLQGCLDQGENDGATPNRTIAERIA